MIAKPTRQVQQTTSKLFMFYLALPPSSGEGEAKGAGTQHMVRLVTHPTYDLIAWLPTHLHTRWRGRGGHRGITDMHHSTKSGGTQNTVNWLYTNLIRENERGLLPDCHLLGVTPIRNHKNIQNQACKINSEYRLGQFYADTKISGVDCVHYCVTNSRKKYRQKFFCSTV